MLHQMSGKKIAWPVFKSGEMADLIAHIRDLVERPDETALLLESNTRPGIAGLRELISALPSPECHYTLQRQANQACLVPDLALRKFSQQIGDAMAAWNLESPGMPMPGMPMPGS